jgi:hypothetical protein
MPKSVDMFAALVFLPATTPKSDDMFATLVVLPATMLEVWWHIRQKKTVWPYLAGSPPFKPAKGLLSLDISLQTLATFQLLLQRLEFLFPMIEVFETVIVVPVVRQFVIFAKEVLVSEFQAFGLVHQACVLGGLTCFPP